MKKLILFFALLASQASAQQLQNLPPNTVVGRLGAGVAGPAQAIPFVSLFAALGGFAMAPTVNNGVVSSGTFTPVCGTNFLQYFTNGGAFTMAAPAVDGTCDLLQINNATAGVVTFSGFTLGSNTGDALDTINGHKFIIHVETINGITTELTKALQ